MYNKFKENILFVIIFEDKLTPLFRMEIYHNETTLRQATTIELPPQKEIRKKNLTHINVLDSLH